MIKSDFIKSNLVFIQLKGLFCVFDKRAQRQLSSPFQELEFFWWKFLTNWKVWVKNFNLIKSAVKQVIAFSKKHLKSPKTSISSMRSAVKKLKKRLKTPSWSGVSYDTSTKIPNKNTRREAIKSLLCALPGDETYFFLKSFFFFK